MALIGRAGEVATTAAVLDRAGAGTGELVVITGPRRIGKTLLADEAGTLARRRGFEVLLVVGHSMGAILATVYAAQYPTSGVVKVDQTLDIAPFAAFLRSIVGRVSKAGTVLDSTGVSISTATGNQSEPAVAFDGTNYLVVWADNRSGAGTSDIYGTRVTKAGTVLSGIPISTAANDQSRPAAAFDGTNYLVVWQDFRSGARNDIYGARVSKAGTVQEASGIPISTAPGHQDEPTVTANGPFLVVWRDQRAGANTDIYGTRMNDAGGILDGSGIAIAANSTAESAPAIAPGPGDKFAVVYQRFTAQAGSQRVLLRTVAPK